MAVVDCRLRATRPGFKEHSSLYCTCRVSADRRGTRGGKVSTANACSALAVRLPAGSSSHSCMVWQNTVQCRMGCLSADVQARWLQVRAAGSWEPCWDPLCHHNGRVRLNRITVADSRCLGPSTRLALPWAGHCRASQAGKAPDAGCSTPMQGPR